jgi:hypothetical protein
MERGQQLNRFPHMEGIGLRQIGGKSNGLYRFPGGCFGHYQHGTGCVFRDARAHAAQGIFEGIVFPFGAHHDQVGLLAPRRFGDGPCRGAHFHIALDHRQAGKRLAHFVGTEGAEAR